MIGRTISHYKILEKLGSGSMGTVYKAEDTKLKRIVALKFLPPHLITGKTEKHRFLHEAQAASALNHPNIITIFDIVDEIDKIFIVMEYCAGKMLTEKLKDGPLKQRELLDIAIDVAEGLNAAHKADITHRDIKSQNIIISDDCPPKIIDFGIAKQRGMTDITKDGTTLGTQCYMSPEQLHGSKVDKRSDIFSFGVVLYEMATGKLPFTGKHDAEILYSVVNEDPIPITTLNPNMDEELHRIVDKALKKDVKDRYQHIDDMLSDLRNLKKKRPRRATKKQSWWRVPAYSAGLLLIVILLYTFVLKKDTQLTDHTLGKKSIAVLPFTTIDGTEESEIFSAGIHDDILTKVARIHDLKVIAKTSVLHFKNFNKKTKEIAKELGVDSILEGSVRRSGNKIRIVVQLIDSETEALIWADTYDRDYSDIFLVQSDVAQNIAAALQTKLSDREIQEIEEVPTKNLKAYDYYLRGNLIISKGFEIDNFMEAITQFEKAIELDSNYTAAYAKLSYANLCIGWRSLSLSEDYLTKIKNILNRAIELDADHPEVLLSEAYYYYWGFQDFDKAQKKLSAALKINPNNSELLYSLGVVKRRYGKWDEALDLLIEAATLDPQSYLVTNATGFTAGYLREWELAEQFYDQALQINPKNKTAYIGKINLALRKNGDLSLAKSLIKETLRFVHPDEIIFERAEIEYFNGEFQKALKICQEYHETGEGTDILYLWNKGRYSMISGNDKLANFYFDRLVIICEKILKADSNNILISKYLAMAYGRLGLKSQSLNLVDKLINFAQETNDAIQETDIRTGLVDIFLSIENYDRAINEIEYLLSSPSMYSVALLKIDPFYDPIREKPIFQKMVNRI
ncbi:protein kinase [Candidatus Neomarinimicrobiota bacterium]